MGDELRAAENYGAKNTASSMRARLEARQEAMVGQYGSKDGALVALDAQLRALLGDATAQGLPVVDFKDFKDYLIFTRQIFRADARLEMNTLRREFGAMCSFWTARGLLYPWLCRIGYVIFGITEDEMDHALLTHLAYADAAHTGFSPAAGGNPAASAPGDTVSAGSSGTPSNNDHRHKRESFGDGINDVCRGNDSRLSDDRTPVSHNNTKHAAGGAPAAPAPGDTVITGISVTDAKSDHVHAREAFGTGAGTVCQGNDYRLADARVPTTHGNDKHNFIGSSFPGSPATNDLYYHTTYGEWFFFDGTRWLSVCVRSCTLNDTRVQPNNDALLQAAAPRQPSNLDMYVIALDWSWIGDTIQSGTKYITYTLTREPSATSIGSFNTSAGTSANVWIGGRVALTALTGTSDICLALTASRTSTPGNGTVAAVVRYRLVGV
jgi:hypothetical protein